MPGASEAPVGLTIAALDVTERSDLAYFIVLRQTGFSMHQCNASDMHICLGSEKETMTSSWLYLSGNDLRPRARRLQRRSQLLSVSSIQTIRYVPKAVPCLQVQFSSPIRRNMFSKTQLAAAMAAHRKLQTCIWTKVFAIGKYKKRRSMC